VEEELNGMGTVDPLNGNAALALFAWSQKSAKIWRGSNTAVRRQILDTVCLNRQVSDVTLVTTKKKPFDFLVERLKNDFSRGDRI
jgi:site-specific DNA recombinase